MSTCLQVDLGNSRAKWRLMDQGAVLARGSFVPLSKEMFADVPAAPRRIWVSSVAGTTIEDALATAVTRRWGVSPWFARTPARCRGLVNSYAEPARMGVDRWLAMLGARARCDGRFCVVDAGSALTIDLVGRDGRHEGGYIIPGAHLMEQSLLRDTDRVRFDESVPYLLAPGRSTAEAVRNGISLAQAGAVTLALARLGGPEPALFYCGGGAQQLNASLNRPGEVAPDLVFEGLEIMALEPEALA